MTQHQNLLNLGKTVDNISVSISYRIIELFSAGLYSSPNKAFEELICNSYDAFAKNVAVYVSDDLSAPEAYIWVCDNGEGLNGEELKNLWKIGLSHKRTDTYRDSKRLQIGQFGIGKLSTYILARKLTYISKKNSQYLMVTMDYDRISNNDDDGIDPQKIQLDEKEISTEEAKQIMTYYIKCGVGFELFGKQAADTWTFSILTDLKTKASEIKLGRLKWILSTALPLNPDFNLKLNNEDIKSSKIDEPILKEWIIGKNDDTAKILDFATTKTNQKETGEVDYFVDFDNLKNVHGKITLYSNSLVDGKASKLGRSHGIFLIIRGRLINLDDPLLGMDAFSHGTFNRTRFEVYADGLDQNLTSTRESVRDSKPLTQLKEYLKKKFNNEVRKFYMEITSDPNDNVGIARRMAKTSYSASKRPLVDFIIKYYADKITMPYLIEVPSTDEKELLLQQYNKKDIDPNRPFIDKREVITTMGISEPMCKLNLRSNTLKINIFHPFVANYIHEFHNILPLESILISEVLTEAYMYQLNIEEENIRSIMMQRDSILRELATTDQAGLPAVILSLRNALSDPTGLEEEVTKSFQALGFEAQHIGGNGTPDGKAEAVLGYSSDTGKSLNYSFTYDTKSTKKAKIAAGTAHLAALKRHQKDYAANYCVEVAINYEGEADPKSAICKESIQQHVTMLTARNLVKILLLAGPKQLGLKKLEELFKNAYSPVQVTQWIDTVEKSKLTAPPYDKIIDIIYAQQSTDTEMLTVSVLRMLLNKKLQQAFSTETVKKWLQILQLFIPGYISYTAGNGYVSINATPNVVKNQIATISHMSTIPKELQQMYQVFELHDK